MGLSRQAVTPAPGERPFYPELGGNAITSAEEALLHAFMPARKINPSSVLVDDGTLAGPVLLVQINPARLGVKIRNLAPSLILWVGDKDVTNDGQHGWPVRPGETLSLTAGEFYGALYGLYDPTATPTAVYVMEPGS